MAELEQRVADLELQIGNLADRCDALEHIIEFVVSDYVLTLHAIGLLTAIAGDGELQDSTREEPIRPGVTEGTRRDIQRLVSTIRDRVRRARQPV